VFKELIERIAISLDKEGIPYMIIGGQAVLLYGEPRFTKDIDITLGIDVDTLDKVLVLTSKLSLTILVNDVVDFVKKTMVLPSLDVSTGIRVDWIFSHSNYERQAIERVRNIKFGETPVKFASLEDVVIHKIIAGRARDIEDASSILLKNPGYDYQYISNWLKKFDESLGESFVETFKKLIKDKM